MDRLQTIEDPVDQWYIWKEMGESDAIVSETMGERMDELSITCCIVMIVVAQVFLLLLSYA